ncbi:DUF937 domain-containing protein [Microvirga roseola]|uniref:DUF937 domain-containing protein n=1 Tax=Microvirga roseola TaxID=2883126 RepID=UPI001E5C7F52|nr:DUF937 domain-containing protein [Microvirga roseola]
MFNWFDLVQQAQAHAGLSALTRQFQLSNDQMQKAMAAIMPAFAMGLQHNIASNPAQFFQSMMGGAFPNPWQGTGQAFAAQAQQEGRRVLDQIFGSDEVSRRVAHQAADFAGISVETMQQLLPVFAGLFAGAMSQWAMAQTQAMQAFAPQAGAAQGDQKAANPPMDLWGGWMKTASPDEQSKASSGQERATPAANPFEGMMTAFMQMPQAPKPEEQPNPAGPAAPWEEMMEKGREMQAQYIASLQSIFADAWKIDLKKP